MNLNKILQVVGLNLICLSPSFSQTKVINGFAQGTSYRIVYYAETALKKTEIDSVLHDLDSSLSIYKPYSLISKFNQLSTNEIKLDQHLFAVVTASFKHYKLSSGLFDITVGPLTALYKKNKTPNTSEIKQALRTVGMHHLVLRDSTLIKTIEGVKIDVDGIAQGYSVDYLSHFIEQKNIFNYLVEIGGEIKSSGTHPDGKPFKVAVEIIPDGNTQESFEHLSIYNEAVTSSGKIRANHINPKTGVKIATPYVLSTVKCPNAIDADAFDNYVSALTSKKLKKLVKRYKLGVLLIGQDLKEKYRSKYF